MCTYKETILRRVPCYAPLYHGFPVCISTLNIPNTNVIIARSQVDNAKCEI